MHLIPNVGYGYVQLPTAASLSWHSHESTKTLWNACRFVEPRHLYLTDSRRIPLLSSLWGVLPNPRLCTIAQANTDAPI
jgi:hypothetical protein